MDADILLARHEALWEDYLRATRQLAAYRAVFPWMVRAVCSEGGGFEHREAARRKLYEFMDNPEVDHGGR